MGWTVCLLQAGGGPLCRSAITVLAVVATRRGPPPKKTTESLEDADPRSEKPLDVAGQSFAHHEHKSDEPNHRQHQQGEAVHWCTSRNYGRQAPVAEQLRRQARTCGKEPADQPVLPVPAVPEAQIGRSPRMVRTHVVVRENPTHSGLRQDARRAGLLRRAKTARRPRWPPPTRRELARGRLPRSSSNDSLAL